MDRSGPRCVRAAAHESGLRSGDRSFLHEAESGAGTRRECGRAYGRRTGARDSCPLGSAPGGRDSVTTAVLTADAIRQALRQVKDPELDLNIVDLGLVYD